MMEWLMTIAGIFFGGGMLGQLIMFFVKRHDAKVEKCKEQYHALHIKLCEYKDEICQILLEYYRTTNKLSEAIDEKDSLSSKYIADIENHLAQIKKQERKCKKQRANEDVCAQCNQRREQLPKLLEKLQEEQNATKGLFEQYRGYWRDNEEHLYKSFAKYLNLHNYLLANNIRDKRLYEKISEVDKQSLDILTPINKNRDGFSKVLINLIETIEYALIMLSKKM